MTFYSKVGLEDGALLEKDRMELTQRLHLGGEFGTHVDGMSWRSGIRFD